MFIAAHADRHRIEIFRSVTGRKPSRIRHACDIGSAINKLKGREGKTLTDARLVEIRALDYPWLPTVYENLCSYIHFSTTHLSDAVELFEDRGGISLRISQSDFDFPESSWLKLIDCFQENTAILVKFLEGYAVTKRLTREQLEKGRRHG